MNGMQKITVNIYLLAQFYLPQKARKELTLNNCEVASKGRFSVLFYFLSPRKFYTYYVSIKNVKYV